jgi:acyl carrier protein
LNSGASTIQPFRKWKAAPGLQEHLVSLPSPATGDISAVPAQEPAALERDLAALFVQALNLEVAAADIDPAAPLFGDGLGLDSIDILEVALEVSQRYGFQLRSDDENNQQIFQSLRTLAAHVALHRTK